jgi:ATP-dependent HslUV protease subunit HslV
VELTKDWRTDRVLRHLEALMIAVSNDYSLIISGNGDVIESDDDVMAIGSGGPYAQAAARALVRHTNMTSTEIAREAMKIAAEICIYTNDHITMEEIDVEAATKGKKNSKDKG